MDSILAVSAWAASACLVALLGARLGATWWRSRSAAKPAPLLAITPAHDRRQATAPATALVQPDRMPAQRVLLEKTLGNRAFGVEETPTLPMARLAAVSEFPGTEPAPLDAVAHPALSR